MKPIADVAKLQLGDVPEFTSLTMPKKQLGATQLVAAATRWPMPRSRTKPVFTEVGLPDDFITQLHTAADAVTHSVDGRQEQVGQSDQRHRGPQGSRRARAGVVQADQRVGRPEAGQRRGPREVEGTKAISHERPRRCALVAPAQPRRRHHPPATAAGGDHGAGTAQAAHTGGKYAGGISAPCATGGSYAAGITAGSRRSADGSAVVDLICTTEVRGRPPSGWPFAFRPARPATNTHEPRRSYASTDPSLRDLDRRAPGGAAQPGQHRASLVGRSRWPASPCSSTGWASGGRRW